MLKKKKDKSEQVENTSKDTYDDKLENYSAEANKDSGESKKKKVKIVKSDSKRF